MELAINETKRRREKQMAHNLKHGITPTTIIRKIHDLKEGFVDSTYTDSKPQFKVAEDHPEYKLDNPKQLGKLIAKLEKKMFTIARNIEFEEAAKTHRNYDFSRAKLKTKTGPKSRFRMFIAYSIF